jgi:hypothetical protein
MKGTVDVMKKNQSRNKVSKRKLALRLEHIVELTPSQLSEVPGGVSNAVVSCDYSCSRPV